MFNLLEEKKIKLIMKGSSHKKYKIIYLKKYSCNIGEVISINFGKKIRLLKKPKLSEWNLIKYEFYNDIIKKESKILKFLDSNENRIYFDNFILIKIRGNNKYGKN